jgi:hypothetical protein
MEKNARDLALYLLLGPVGMLGTQARGLQFSRRPVKLLRQRQPTFRRHSAENLELFGRGLFVGQHGVNLPQGQRTGKPFALARVVKYFRRAIARSGWFR